PSGKAPDSDSGIRWFESIRGCHLQAGPRGPGPRRSPPRGGLFRGCPPGPPRRAVRAARQNPPMTVLLSPPLTEARRLCAPVRVHGCPARRAQARARAAHGPLRGLAALEAGCDDLPPDGYLRDGGRYRRRRHSCFVVEAGQVRQAPHRAHWQPVEYNALHGGMWRMFEPVAPATVASPAWPALLRALAGWCSALAGERPWYVEAHQFRIDTGDGIGRPTPEGAHRDGVD